MDEKEILSLKNSCEEIKNLREILKKSLPGEDSILINTKVNSLFESFLKKSFVDVDSINLSHEPNSPYNTLSTGNDSTDKKTSSSKEEDQRNKVVQNTGANNWTDNSWLLQIDFAEDGSEDEISLENQLNYKRVSSFKSKYGNRFLEIIRESAFEYGYDSFADEFFRERFKENRLAAKEWINQMFIENFGKSEIVTGILRVIAHLSYSDIAPQGPTMALAALNHQLPEVRECGVRALENWGTKECLNTLRSVSYTEQWLNNYIEQVISDLEESFSNASVSTKN
jgi:hypothetical protein